MSGSNVDQDGFRMDRSTGKRGGLAGGHPDTMAQAYGDATAILGRPWQVPPPNVEFFIPQGDKTGIELAQLLRRLREQVSNAPAGQSAPLGNALEAFIHSLRETAGSGAAPADASALGRLRAARTTLVQLADSTPMQQTLEDLCAFPPIAVRL